MLWSPENCRLYGLEPQGYAPEYKTWRASVHADDIEQVEAHREQTVRAGDRYQAEYRIRKPSGEVRWLASQGKAFHDEHGKPVRMLGINIDITERRRIEEERVKFQALVESSLDYIGIADLDNNCFYLNPAGRLLLGIDSEEEVRHCRPEDFVADVDRPFYANTVMPMLRLHGRWEGDGKLKHQKPRRHRRPSDALRRQTPRHRRAAMHRHRVARFAPTEAPRASADAASRATTRSGPR